MSNRRWKLKVPPWVGAVPISVAAIVGAVVVWPSDLSWALFVLAAAAWLVSFVDLSVEFD